MKKVLLMMTVLMLMASLVGCASIQPIGIAYTDLNLPLNATSNDGKASKVGTSECKSVLTLVAWGDCSIETAKKNGGITKVHHIDFDVNNILGIYGKYTVTVYGE